MSQAISPESNITSLDHYRFRKKLESNGLEWLEDENGKVKIWLRMGQENESRLASRVRLFLLPEKPQT